MEIETTRTSSQKRKCHKKMKPKTIKTDMYPVYDNIDAATYVLPVTITPHVDYHHRQQEDSVQIEQTQIVGNPSREGQRTGITPSILSLNPFQDLPRAAENRLSSPAYISALSKICLPCRRENTILFLRNWIATLGFSKWPLQDPVKLAFRESTILNVPDRFQTTLHTHESYTLR